MGKDLSAFGNKYGTDQFGHIPSWPQNSPIVYTRADSLPHACK